MSLPINPKFLEIALQELSPGIPLTAVFYGALGEELRRQDLGLWYQDAQGMVCPCDPCQKVELPAESVRFELVSRGIVLKSADIADLLAGRC